MILKCLLSISEIVLVVHVAIAKLNGVVIMIQLKELKQLKEL